MTRTLSVLQLTDTHLPCLLPRPNQAGYDTVASLRALVAALLAAAQRPDLVLVTGDIADTGTQAAYELLAELLQPLAAPIHCLAGNHDVPERMQQVLPPLGLSCAASVLLGDWHIVCLDSSQPGRTEGELGAQRLADLAATLKAQPQRPTLIALHHPPLAVGTPWMDVHALRDGTTLLSLLAQHLQVRGVIFGHIHQAYYGNWAQMQLWGTPSTCVQFVPGSLQFTLDPSTGPTARWLFLANNGTIGSKLFTTSPC